MLIGRMDGFLEIWDIEGGKSSLTFIIVISNS